MEMKGVGSAASLMVGKHKKIIYFSLFQNQNVLAKSAKDPKNFWNLLKQLKTDGKLILHKEDLPP